MLRCHFFNGTELAIVCSILTCNPLSFYIEKENLDGFSKNKKSTKRCSVPLKKVAAQLTFRLNSVSINFSRVCNTDGTEYYSITLGSQLDNILCDK